MNRSPLADFANTTKISSVVVVLSLKAKWSWVVNLNCFWYRVCGGMEQCQRILTCEVYSWGIPNIICLRAFGQFETMCVKFQRSLVRLILTSPQTEKMYGDPTLYPTPTNKTLTHCYSSMAPALRMT